MCGHGYLIKWFLIKGCATMIWTGIKSGRAQLYQTHINLSFWTNFNIFSAFVYIDSGSEKGQKCQIFKEAFILTQPSTLVMMGGKSTLVMMGGGWLKESPLFLFVKTIELCTVLNFFFFFFFDENKPILCAFFLFFSLYSFFPSAELS